MIDRTAKIILSVLALGLYANAIVPLLRPITASAQRSFKCEGELKANAWGGIEATVGGYKVAVDCR